MCILGRVQKPHTEQEVQTVSRLHGAENMAGRRLTDDVTVRMARHEDYDGVMGIDRNVYDVSLYAG